MHHESTRDRGKRRVAIEAAGVKSLLLSAHDFRTPRKASIHFIAQELARRGPTRFLSLRYSGLSRWNRDARCFLDERANRVEHFQGVDCYLWKTAVHPFNTRRPSLRPIEDAFFRWSMARPPAVLVRWMREAETIFFESGSAILQIALAARVNPLARRVYIASDDLGTIEAAPFVRQEFDRVAAAMDALCLPSPRLADGMVASDNKYFVPHGFDRTVAQLADPSPYDSAVNAVSVGSMLFDPMFFERAAPAFPAVTFHVIGPGPSIQRRFPANVRVYDEMPFADTLRYIKHATIGIAPYRGNDVPPYLADTSMKLAQYQFFGVPAVCPVRVTGDADDRFGYEPDDEASIIAAVKRALKKEHVARDSVLSWRDVTDRLIAPTDYEDTRIVLGAGARVPSSRDATRSRQP